MDFNFSTFGNKFGEDCGIVQLMDDLGQYVGRDDIMMLGGGNPARISEIEQYYEKQMEAVLAAGKFANLIGQYADVRGYPEMVDALVMFFQEQYGWAITADNIVLTNGSHCLLYTSPSPRDATLSRMPSSA